VSFHRWIWSSPAIAWCRSKSCRVPPPYASWLRAGHLLFEFHLHSVDMDTLANHQYVIVKWGIPYENLPRHWHKSAPKQRSNNVNDWDVENKDTSWVSRQIRGKHFLVKHKEPEAWSVKDVFLNEVNCCLSFACWVELLCESPVAVRVIWKDSIIAVIAQIKTCCIDWVGGLQRLKIRALVSFLSDYNQLRELRYYGLIFVEKTRFVATDLVYQSTDNSHRCRIIC
jgi:hypothetical protein